MEKTCKPTCGRCRTKKIVTLRRRRPLCGPCSRARVDSLNCKYTALPLSHGPELRKGAACSACRSVRGDWPCRTCIVSKKEDGCKYDDGSQLSFTRALIERTHELEKLLSEAKQTAAPNILDYTVGSDLSAELDQLLSTTTFVAPDPILLHQDLSIHPPELGRGAAMPPPPKEDVFQLLEALQERPSRSLQAAEFPIEKMTHIRNLFLTKQWQFGFVLPAHKLNAVAAGDLSGVIVHPVLVHVCHLWGYLFYDHEKTQTWIFHPDQHDDEVAQMRLILGSLSGMLGPPPDPITTLFTYSSISLYFFHKADMCRGTEFLKVASETALKHDLDLAVLAQAPVPADDGTYSILPLNDASELRSTFSHLIYTATAARAVLAVPPIIDARLVDKFEVIMIHAHIGVLHTTQLRISFIPDSHTIALVLKLCSTMTLAALAGLHGIFAPSHSESWRRYRDAYLSADDCRYLDPILPLCWSVATRRILDNEVVYENQESIITAIRDCNDNLHQALPFVISFETWHSCPEAESAILNRPFV
ncbi:hypothetical protein R3P38DRAFT_2909420 [Favolaschia claudopus]|uniref:Zn(2)-C6 fungal-type domain-containing protein n=1 Tax=Favolaschia claudopus TaxID=2862362 RepID=A0AAW0CBJ8_9AGAR